MSLSLVAVKESKSLFAGPLTKVPSLVNIEVWHVHVKLSLEYFQLDLHPAWGQLFENALITSCPTLTNNIPPSLNNNQPPVDFKIENDGWSNSIV